MSERYKKLYHLEHRLYASGAPVLIEAGALLLDQPSNAMLCQLRFRNIQPRPIKALRAAVQMLDATGSPLGKPVDHRYLNLDLKREEEYGRDTAIVLPSAEASSFTVRLSQVNFSDGEVWTDEGAEWEPLPEQPELEDFCDNPAQADRFRKRFGSDCRLGPLETDELWFCACGAVNPNSESRCHRCRCRRSALLGRDLRDSDREEALALEPEEQEPLDTSRRVRRIWLGAAALALMSLLAVVLLPRLKTAPKAAAAPAAETAVEIEATASPAPTDGRKALYEEALALMEAGNYLGAEASFLSLGDFEDSAELAAQCRETLDNRELELLRTDYEAAAALLEAGRYAEAREAFLSLGDFEDSAEQAREALYRKAMALYDYISAHDVRGVTAALTEEADGVSRVALPRERLLVLGNPDINELEAAFGADSVRFVSAGETDGTFLPFEEAAAALFTSLGDYRDSAELAALLPEMMDRSGEFFALCMEGRLEEAQDWLNAYDKPFDDRELWLTRLERYLPYCRGWELYSGDPTLVPMIGGSEQPVYSFRGDVILREDAAVLRILLNEDDTAGPELIAELDEGRFLLHTDRFSYLAEISPGSGHLSVIKLNDSGIQGGAEFAPAK